ncbi:hypothetical protein C0J45_17710 [Silurus meridionalis]|nr:hypothetical protein C0J45_17710 [Silurus meridionalis]
MRYRSPEGRFTQKTLKEIEASVIRVVLQLQAFLLKQTRSISPSDYLCTDTTLEYVAASKRDPHRLVCLCVYGSLRIDCFTHSNQTQISSHEKS